MTIPAIPGLQQPIAVTLTRQTPRAILRTRRRPTGRPSRPRWIEAEFYCQFRSELLGRVPLSPPEEDGRLGAQPPPTGIR